MKFAKGCRLGKSSVNGSRHNGAAAWMPSRYREMLHFNASLIRMLPAIAFFDNPTSKQAEQSASPRHKSMEMSLPATGHSFSRHEYF